jgi:hypothetical protein
MALHQVAAFFLFLWCLVAAVTAACKALCFLVDALIVECKVLCGTAENRVREEAYGDRSHVGYTRPIWYNKIMYLTREEAEAVISRMQQQAGCPRIR